MSNAVGFWDEHAGKMLATLMAAFVLASGAWAVQMDRQSVEIALTLKQIQRQLDGLNSSQGQVIDIDKRVSRIEDTRFSAADARALRDKCDAMQLRLSDLERKRRR